MSDQSLLVSELENDEIKEILASGTDLRQYAQEIDKEFKSVENQSIKDYIKESENIASLHTQILECDDILATMEGMLTDFQSVLSNISSEITTLQKKSVSMSVQLTNRQQVRMTLQQFVRDMAIPEEMIQSIMSDSPVTDKEFLLHLNELNHKLGKYPILQILRNSKLN